MEEKEKYRAHIESKLTKFGETLEQIKTRHKENRENLPGLKIESTIQKHEAAMAKLEELKEADESSWDKFKFELDNYVNDIDEDLREALAYFG